MKGKVLRIWKPPFASFQSAGTIGLFGPDILDGGASFQASVEVTMAVYAYVRASTKKQVEDGE